MDKWPNFRKELNKLNQEALELENRIKTFISDVSYSDVQIGEWFPDEADNVAW